MSIVETKTCRGHNNNCKNALIQIPEWESDLHEWIRTQKIEEKIFDKLKDIKIREHHRLKISISGCPNACSQPQIADIGIVGYSVPSFDPEKCTLCGQCESACPDEAITVGESPLEFDSGKCQGCTKCSIVCPSEGIKLSEPGVRLFLGGKLGRHPHLAVFHSKMKSPEELIKAVDAVVTQYLNSDCQVRFAEYYVKNVVTFRSNK